jgi:mannose/fructose/sorbose-specific phosphotransferase system IIA component
MIKLVLVCHGTLAEGFLKAMSLITGPQEAVTAIDLGEEDSIDELESRVETAVQSRQPGQAVLILVDLFGASPFNVSARVASRNEEVEVITGVNLAILLETATRREEITLPELTALARVAGSGSVKVLSDLMGQGNAGEAD